MSKQINLEYEGKIYILEFTRESIKQMEREGFELENVMRKPMSTLPMFFAGAFKAHHKFDAKQKKIEEIYEKVNDKQALFSKLLDMYQYPMEELMDNENNEGNAIAWDANF
jgi:predicted metallopeptidase